MLYLILEEWLASGDILGERADDHDAALLASIERLQTFHMRHSSTLLKIMML